MFIQGKPVVVMVYGLLICMQETMQESCYALSCCPKTTLNCILLQTT